MDKAKGKPLTSIISSLQFSCMPLFSFSYHKNPNATEYFIFIRVNLMSTDVLDLILKFRLTKCILLPLSFLGFYTLSFSDFSIFLSLGFLNSFVTPPRYETTQRFGFNRMTLLQFFCEKFCLMKRISWISQLLCHFSPLWDNTAVRV